MGVNAIKYVEYIRSKQQFVSAFFIVFYIVGIVGMLLPGTFSLFLKLIPFALLLSFAALPVFHESKMDWKSMLCFLSIFFIAFSVEAIGVSSGKIFGFYKYSNGLGIKIFQTPLIIGINWLFLVYSTSALTEKLQIPVNVKIVLASLAMLVYDMVLEQVAPKLDLWHWKNNVIPIQNYVAWFALAIFFHTVLKILKIHVENKLAFLILVCQFMFFLLLYLVLK
jgi:putative membrane protein